MKRRSSRFLLTAALASLLGAGAAGSALGGTTTIDGKTANYHGTKTVRDGGPLTVKLGDDFFAPTIIKGRAGARVTLVLRNRGYSEHNFTLKAERVRKDLMPGRSATVRVRIPRRGTLLFFCRFHAPFGMRGGLRHT